MSGEDDSPFDGPVELPLDGRLDLHPFRPQDVKDVVIEYARACREKGVLDLELVHGKGIGALRKTVHKVLEKLPEVESFRTAEESRGGWGVTLVRLKPPGP